MINKIASLEREVSELKRKLNQPIRTHHVAGRNSRTLRRNPSDVKSNELEGSEIRPFLHNDQGGLIVRIDGNKYILNATKL